MRLASLLVLLLWSASASAECSGWGGSVWTYQGTRGATDRIRLTLHYFGPAVDGAYYPEHSDQVLKLQGEMHDGRSLHLDVKGPAGSHHAVIDATFQETDARASYAPGTRLKCEALVGTWREDGKSAVPLYLGLDSGDGGGAVGHVYQELGVDDDRVVDAAVQRFQAAVANGQKRVVAAQVRFPLTVDGGKRHLVLKSQRDLIQHYEAIFTADFRRRIVADYGRVLFVRNADVMLGRGEVWFDRKMRVIALQP